MPRGKRKTSDLGPTAGVQSQPPTQQDEADIVAESGAEEEGDELLLGEERARELGAVDAESIRTNRRTKEYINKKRSGEKGVVFNAGDVLARYDAAVMLYPPNTMHIHVKRMTGTPVQTVITSHPRSGAELYDALTKFHERTQSPEADYDLRFFDTNTKEWRGTGRITLPDAQSAQAQQGQPMYHPPGYPPPQPGFGAPQGYAPPPAQAQAPAIPQPQQTPVVVQAPAGFDMNSMISGFSQLWEMFQRMAPQPQPQPGVPMAAPVPPTAATPDMGAMMAWFGQLMEMAQRMNPGASTTPAGSTPAAPAPNPMMAMMGGMMGVPPMSPPPGTMWVPGFGFVPVERLMQALGVGSAGGPGPYREREAGRPPYRQQYDGRRQYDGRPPYQPPAPPPPPKTPMDQMREALSLARAAQHVIDEFRSLSPDGGDTHEPAPPAEDNSPVRIIEAGAAKLIADTSSGNLRFVDTLITNLPGIAKWGAEQMDQIRQSRAGQRPSQRRLPAGYVEVTEDYRPPPGMVAIPEEPPPQHQGLPPPPQHVPPPISPAPAPRRSWSAPPTSFPE